MMVKNKKNVNPSEEFTSINNSVKNHSQDTNFLINETKTTLKNSINTVESLIVDLSSVKKGLRVKTTHYKSYNNIYNLLLKIHTLLNTEIKSKTLEFKNIIDYAKLQDKNLCGVRITLNILPKKEGKIFKTEYYKNRYYSDVIIRSFHDLEKEINTFKKLHITNSYIRKILNNILNETKDIKEYLKTANILHLLYFKRELKNLDPKNNKIDSLICYYYWTEKGEFLMNSSLDLWI